jgi:hypothetical protein
VEGGYWEPSSNDSAVETTRETILTADGTHAIFRLPLGSYVASHIDDILVFISTDGGVTWIDQQLGADFAFYYSGRFNPGFSQPPSVQDVASGIEIVAGVPSAGWRIKIQWIERISPFVPRSIVPARFTGSPYTVDNSFSWETSNDAHTPNGILLPQGPDGYVPELWRVTKHKGGLNRDRAGFHFIGGGRRLIPYFRGPQANVVDPNAIVLVGGLGISTASARKFKFRVCYYNPTTRARTAFAPGLITVFGRIDRHNGNSLTVRRLQTVYVEPS